VSYVHCVSYMNHIIGSANVYRISYKHPPTPYQVASSDFCQKFTRNMLARAPRRLSDGHSPARRIPSGQLGFSLSLSAYASKQIARPHSPAVVLKARARSLPTKILDILKYGHIQSQGCKSAKQQGLAPRIVKRFGQ
jgi:hypothetical protein